jgi:sirohydrochlorin cobaltochelatase
MPDMPDPDLHDAALVLIGHGSTLNAESAAPAYQHAAELRRRGVFAQVREAFWKQEPLLGTVVSNIRAPRLFLVPLFISEGFYTEEAIPRELGFRSEGDSVFERRQQRGEQTWYYCHPIGTHESMTLVILARAAEVLGTHPFPRSPKPEETALFVAGHGTSRNENSRKAIDQQVERIRGMRLYAETHAVFMEEDPRIGDVYALTQQRHLVVVPFFISDGLHSREDIPVLLGEPERIVRARLEAGQPTWRNPSGKHGKLVWYARSVGTEANIANVIVERVKEAIPWGGDGR